MAAEQTANHPADEGTEVQVCHSSPRYRGNMFPEPSVTAVEFVILDGLFQRLLRLVAALGAQDAQLLFADRFEELRRRLLTALWTGDGITHWIMWVTGA